MFSCQSWSILYVQIAIFFFKTLCFAQQCLILTRCQINLFKLWLDVRHSTLAIVCSLFLSYSLHSSPECREDKCGVPRYSSMVVQFIYGGCLLMASLFYFGLLILVVGSFSSSLILLLYKFQIYSVCWYRYTTFFLINILLYTTCTIENGNTTCLFV